MILVFLGFMLFLVAAVVIPQFQAMDRNVKKLQTPSGATLVNRIRRTSDQFIRNDFNIILPGSREEEHVASNKDPGTSFDQNPNAQATNEQGTWVVTIGEERYKRLKPDDPHQRWDKVEGE